ncbi:hypothetical protein AWI25_10485 [Enterobacter hormaechei subsp. oharae]|nr:hypothetical protein BFV66_02310 [Enterobacter hormaechei subsp. oharae]KPR21391.1 hypothetical protein AN666_02720 [Enterobacter hormaechei]KTK11435.1 hypothetical protein ASU69_02975 [Enterobacter hormaechei subsp. oharae]KTK16558.1 hypothetical protein ASU68_03420 [Enterobacter hormaechei subsp. oharae]KUQ75221.1 hypothetical protein AWI25_10485 [Enterobacter hormaechei subsp. oharae]
MIMTVMACFTHRRKRALTVAIALRFAAMHGTMRKLNLKQICRKKCPGKTVYVNSRTAITTISKTAGYRFCQDSYLIKKSEKTLMKGTGIQAEVHFTLPVLCGEALHPMSGTPVSRPVVKWAIQQNAYQPFLVVDMGAHPVRVEVGGDNYVTS